MADTSNIDSENPGISTKERRFVIGFCLVLVLAPLVFGELFPFTSAPMFRDAPKVYCVYGVTGPDGQPLSLKTFRLHQNYDGNPVGMGGGRTPEPTLNIFGQVQDMEQVRKHVQRYLNDRHPSLAFVDVQQRVFGALSENRVGLLSAETIRVKRHAQ